MQIELTAADRNGRRLETRVVRGHSWAGTLEERLEVYDHFNRVHRDHDGLGPYIFTSTTYNEAPS